MVAWGMTKPKERWTDWNDPNQRIPTKATPLPDVPVTWQLTVPAETMTACPDARYAPGPVKITCFRPDIPPPVVKLPVAESEWLSGMQASQMLGVTKQHFAIMAKRLNLTRRPVKGNPRKGEPLVLFNRAEILRHRRPD